MSATLMAKGVKFEYEALVLYYNKKVRKGKCESCGSTKVVQVKSYTPDFQITINGLLIEVKGRFTAPDRAKLIAVKKDNPSIKLVLYFASDNRLSKGAEKHYSDWCQQHNFDFSVGSIPRRWLNEKKNTNIT